MAPDGIGSRAGAGTGPPASRHRPKSCRSRTARASLRRPLARPIGIGPPSIASACADALAAGSGGRTIPICAQAPDGSRSLSVRRSRAGSGGRLAQRTTLRGRLRIGSRLRWEPLRRPDRCRLTLSAGARARPLSRKLTRFPIRNCTRARMHARLCAHARTHARTRAPVHVRAHANLSGHRPSLSEASILPHARDPHLFFMRIWRAISQVLASLFVRPRNPHFFCARFNSHFTNPDNRPCNRSRLRQGELRKGETRMSKRRTKMEIRADKASERACCCGLRVNMMDFEKIHQFARSVAPLHSSDDALNTVVLDYVRGLQ